MTNADPPATPTLPRRLEDQLCLDLYVTSRIIVNAYRNHLAPYQLTYPQYLVMLALWQFGPQSVNQLSERLVLDAGTLSPMLKRLEATGYVTRQRLAHDARELRVTPTPSGLALREVLADVTERVMCATGLSRDAQRELQLTLRSVARNLKTNTDE